MNNFTIIHPDLIAAKKHVYDPCQFVVEKITPESESQQYGACTLYINNKLVTFRVANITLTKIGQFVVLWKRINAGPIMPFDMSDPVDLFVISVRNATHFGQFVFPKALLLEKGFISLNGKGGKRAMRVYPPWDTPSSKQAEKTQFWQNIYFFGIDLVTGVDIIRVKKLFF